MTETQNPLPDILDFLLTLFMASSTDMGRDEVRKHARTHWMALGNYMKGLADAPMETEVDRTPPRPPTVERKSRVSSDGNTHRQIRQRFAPRTHRVA